MKINISITDDDGNSYQGEIELVKNQSSNTVVVNKTTKQKTT